MKRLSLLILALSLHAATYYVASSTSSPPGSDSNTGTQAAPWLTVQHGVNSMSCGDTLIVVADGNYVSGDVTAVPSGLTSTNFLNCGRVTSIISSKLSLLQPVGYRTNPTNDNLNYGKLNFTTGILMGGENHGSFTQSGGNPNGNYCQLSSIAGDIFTIAACGGELGNLANGSQIEFEINTQGGNATAIPSQLTFQQKYYVVNCSSCSVSGGTFQVAATSGGSPITGNTCTGACQLNRVMIFEPLQITVGSATIGSPDNISWPVGTPIVFNSPGVQFLGTLPAPLALNTPYYVLSGTGTSSFTISTTLGGSAISFTSVGRGGLQASNINVPNLWAFRGLETTQIAGKTIYGFIQIGSGGESSSLAMVSRIEIDRCYIHGLVGDSTPPIRAIVDQGKNTYVHDSYCSGIFGGESQCIFGAASLGPSAYLNSFLEAAGESTLWGGYIPANGGTNSDKLFAGNYYYKPPVMRVTTGTGGASGNCWYDTTDPSYSGGEWWQNTSTSQWQQCTSAGTWGTAGATAPTIYGSPFWKDLAEHKNGQRISYIGNLFNFSWVYGQAGEIWNNSQEYFQGPGMANDHILMMNNAAFHFYVAQTRTSECGFSSQIVCQQGSSSQIQRNNLLVSDPHACGFGTSSCGTAISGQTEWENYGTLPSMVTDIWEHNTMYAADSGYAGTLGPFYANFPVSTCSTVQGAVGGALWRNSILPGDFVGDCYGAGYGGTVIGLFFTGSTFTNIALKGGTSGTYGSVGPNSFNVAASAYPANNAAVGYVNATGTPAGDYHLTTTSNYSAAYSGHTLISTDGTDLGADIDVVNMWKYAAQNGVPLPSVTVSPGSVNTILSFNAPTMVTCTANLYSASGIGPWPRNANTLISTTSDTLSNGTWKQIVLTTATSTQYAFTVTCGGGWIYVGSFSTRATGGGATWTLGFGSSVSLQACTNPTLTSGCSSLGTHASFSVPVGSAGLLYVGGTGAVTQAINAP